jgi:hypothetical protein
MTTWTHLNNTKKRWWQQHFFNIEVSTFFKPCVSHLLKALCYSSLRAFPTSGDHIFLKLCATQAWELSQPLEITSS